MMAFAVLCLFGASQSSAQDTGYISGTVSDKSGAAIANATVVIANASGSSTQTTTTNADGAYVVAGLPDACIAATMTDRRNVAVGFCHGAVCKLASKFAPAPSSREIAYR